MEYNIYNFWGKLVFSPKIFSDFLPGNRNTVLIANRNNPLKNPYNKWEHQIVYPPISAKLEKRSAKKSIGGYVWET